MPGHPSRPCSRLCLSHSLGLATNWFHKHEQRTLLNVRTFRPQLCSNQVATSVGGVKVSREQMR